MLEINLSEKDIDSVDDYDYQIMQDKEEPYLNIYVVLTEEAVEMLAKETGLLEKNGFSDMKAAECTDFQINVYANITEDRKVSLSVTDNGENEVILDNLSEDFASAILDKTDEMLERNNSSVQREFEYHREYEKSENEVELL